MLSNWVQFLPSRWIVQLGQFMILRHNLNWCHGAGGYIVAFHVHDVCTCSLTWSLSMSPPRLMLLCLMWYFIHVFGQSNILYYNAVHGIQNILGGGWHGSVSLVWCSIWLDYVAIWLFDFDGSWIELACLFGFEVDCRIYKVW